MKIIILGAGVVGVSTAYFLSKNGFEVEVIEQNHQSAMGCSKANGCQLSYSHVDPWSSKDSIFSLLKFISLKDLINQDFYRFSYQFLKNSNKEKSSEIAAKINEINVLSKKSLYEIISDEHNLNFDYQNKGIIHFFRDQKSFQKNIKNSQNLAKFDIDFDILNPKQTIDKEPTLENLAAKNQLAGSIFFKNDGGGDIFKFTNQLAEICQKKYQVKFHYNCRVKNILTNYKKITAINCEDEVRNADQYVYCAGFAGAELLKAIGFNAEIYPIKGYSLNIKITDFAKSPKYSITDNHNKIVYSRIGDYYRAAGLASFNRNGDDKRKFLFLKKVTENIFNSFGEIDPNSYWSDFRPYRSDSLPIICRSEKFSNLLINTGHGSLGFTMSAGSAKMILNIIKNEK
jgi:D-amino-acid dehydrogenase